MNHQLHTCMFCTAQLIHLICSMMENESSRFLGNRIVSGRKEAHLRRIRRRNGSLFFPSVFTKQFTGLTGMMKRKLLSLKRDSLLPLLYQHLTKTRAPCIHSHRNTLVVVSLTKVITILRGKRLSAARIL